MPPISEDILLSLEKEKKELEDKIFQHEERIRQIKEFVGHARKLSINWSAEAMKCIRGSYEPLSTDEILRCVFKDDLQDLENPIRRRNYVMQLSLALNRLCGKGVIVGVSIEGHRGKFYGMKEWVKDNGEFHTEYQGQIVYKLKKIEAEKNRASNYG